MAEEQRQPAEAQPAAEERLVRFHYIKSNFFRVVFADGITGSVSPNGDMIRASFFSHRVPIPLQVTHALGPHGELGPQVGAVAKEGMVREVEVEVVMDLTTAHLLIEWLQQRLAGAAEMAGKIAVMKAAVESQRSARGAEETNR